MEELGLSQFHIKRINTNKHVLQLDTESNFSKTKELLQKVGTRFYSYTPRECKIPTFVLKGLHSTYSKDEILHELQGIHIEDLNFCKVIRMITRRASENNILLPIFIVQLRPGSNPGKLKEIKYINYQVVRWEKLIKKDSVQCKRCQRVGHAASNCSMNYRCVKCNEGHGPGECAVPKISNEIEKLFCVNYNSYGHPESYRGCPIIAANKNKIKEKGKLNVINKQNRINKIEAYIKPGISFAEATKTQTHKTNAVAYTYQGMEEEGLPKFQTWKMEYKKFNLILPSLSVNNKGTG